MFYTGMGMEMKKQVYNPYLPSWEYIPDGEPYVFGDRVYVFGSHDRYNGHVFCLNDYVCWSAPLDSLGEWHCSGTIYRKTEDPLNKDLDSSLHHRFSACRMYITHVYIQSR